MCDPATATLALTIASAASTAYAQDQNAKAVTKANQQTYDNQMTAYRMNLANANLTRVQEAENLSQKQIENNAQVRRETAKATVSAGESGVSGLSVDALLAELGGRGGQANMTAQTNFDRRNAAINADVNNMWSGTASSINQLKTPQGADYIGAGLRIAQGFNQYEQGKRGNTTTTGRQTDIR